MQNLMNILGAIFSLMLLAVAIWFGAVIFIALLCFMAVLFVYITARAYYLRWKYGANTSTTIYETHIINERGNEIGKTTIIDAEYKDITENKND